MAGRPRTVDDEQILTIAATAFAEVGFEAVSMRELNRQLGMSPAMLAKRFGTKEALWEAAVGYAFTRHQTHLVARALEILASEPDELVAFEKLVASFVHSAAEAPELQRIINLEACQESPRVDVLFDRFVAPMLEQVRPVVSSLVEAGRIRDVTDRELFFLVANGAATVHALGPLSRRFGPFDEAAYANDVAGIIVRGLTVAR